MSVAGGIVTDVLSKLSTYLGATFTEMPNLFALESLSTKNLANGYGAILLSGGEDQAQINCANTITRTLQVKVSYRTYSAIDGVKTKTVLQTLYTNEEGILNLLSNYQSKPTGLLGMLRGANVNVEPFGDGDDNFLVNTINFVCLYQKVYS